MDKDRRLAEFERLCNEADCEKAKGNRQAAFSLYGQAFDLVGLSGEAFRNLVKTHCQKNGEKPRS